jgi:DNA-binding transcriptional LysR family regulator
MMDLRRLRLLRELSVRGTIGAVAEALSYTPSAVSQQLAVLEREAGVALLERAGRGVRLTPAGWTLVAHAEALLERVEEAEADLEASAREVTGIVRVASFQTAAIYLLAPALDRLAGRHPALRVELVEFESEEALPTLPLGRWDLVLADEYDGLPKRRDARLDTEPLLREQIRMVLPRAHPLAASGEPVSLASLSSESWAVSQPGTHHAEMVVRACRELGGFEPDLRHRSNDLLVLLALVGSGRAVTLLPDLVPAGVNPAVAVRDIADGTPARTIYSAIRRGSARRPAIRALREALREEAAARADAVG